MDARSIRESALASHLEELLKQIDLIPIEREVRIGAFRFDAVARDRSGNLFVVELKVAARMDTLAQLLIYPHVLKKYLRHCGLPAPVSGAVLITTHFDLNVLEVLKSIGASSTTSVWICTGTVPGALRLVAPMEVPDQAWDQSRQGGAARTDEIFRYLRERE